MTEEQQKPRLLTLGWFEPVYRRVILVAFIAVWSIWEWFYNGDQFWGLITLAALGYGIWTFFINYETALKKERDGKPKS